MFLTFLGLVEEKYLGMSSRPITCNLYIIIYIPNYVRPTNARDV